MKKLWQWLNQGDENTKKAYPYFIFIISLVLVFLLLNLCMPRFLKS